MSSIYIFYNFSHRHTINKWLNDLNYLDVSLCLTPFLIDCEDSLPSALTSVELLTYMYLIRKRTPLETSKTYLNSMLCESFSVSTKRKIEGLIYSNAFSQRCLTVSIASVHDRRTRKPCCSIKTFNYFYVLILLLPVAVYLEALFLYGFKSVCLFF
jgi:hypothetical protein